MKRKPSELVANRNKELFSLIESIKDDHPYWGYRRIWATIRFSHNHQVNQKRIYRLMRLHGLTISRDEKIKAIRTPRPKPIPTKPNQIWGIDMTKINTSSGYAYLVIVMDWYTKRIVGYHIGDRCLATDWLYALDVALNNMFPFGVRDMKDERLRLVSDNGCQPTSKTFMQNCHILGIEQIFTSYNNPKGNADTERMIRTIKEELIWVNEWDDPDNLQVAFSLWIESYNNTYLHSSLGYISPCRFELLEMKRLALKVFP